MQINQRPVPEGGALRRIHLACGFTPLHLTTYLRAYARLRFAADDVEIATGLYGNLEGALRRVGQVPTCPPAERSSPAEGAVVVVEWSDIDARLGLRSAAGWGAAVLADIVQQAGDRLRRLEDLIGAVAGAMPVAVVAPTLALPPLTHMPPTQAPAFELRLRGALAGFLERIAESPRVRVLSDTALAKRSPYAERHDIQLDLRTDFPYTLAHAAAVADLAIECLLPRPPRKGLITDLDDTLWQGILGDAGVDGVAWSLDRHAQPHGLYQQLLGSLAESGILIAVASRNDPAPVAEALDRPDILLKRAQIYPVMAGWGPKSESVARILKAWNIGEDSVVFVDDSPMELAEVGEKFPAMECLRFPSGDAAAVVALIHELRARFGKIEVREEDRLRAGSLSASAAFLEERSDGASPGFLARLQAKLTLEYSTGADARAFELVNKTNQFNLNGRRFTEAEWTAYFQAPGAFLLTAGYDDRFGPLGKIAALMGCRTGDGLRADAWVLSCRAFSRQIEFQMLRHLFDKHAAQGIAFCFQATPRNGPLQEFFGRFLQPPLDDGRLELPAALFDQHCPSMFHQVIEKNG